MLGVQIAGFNASRGPQNEGRRKRRWENEMDDHALRVALQRHWDASDANDFEIEHDI